MDVISSEPNPAYHQILQSLFQQSSGQPESQAVLFTSANPGEGVTHVVHALSEELALNSAYTVAVFDARKLSLYTDSPERLLDYCRRDERTGVYHFVPSSRNGSDHGATTWHLDARFRDQCMHILRKRFSYVLYDCPSPKKSGELFSLASMMNGVVVVVEANKTPKYQIRNVARTVESAKGHIVGFVLNKRQYSIPEWLYKRL